MTQKKGMRSRCLSVCDDPCADDTRKTTSTLIHSTLLPSPSLRTRPYHLYLSMADHAEEQEMEAEALQAIFDTHFSILEPQKWQIEIYPEMTADADELEELNHVAANLIVELPATYPEVLPVLDCQIVKGLVEEHRQELLALAQEEATANEGVPSIFAVAERLREWLAENNQKGLDDLSMHAQMLRKQQAKEKEVSANGGSSVLYDVQFRISKEMPTLQHFSMEMLGPTELPQRLEWSRSYFQSKVLSTAAKAVPSGFL